MHQTLVPIAPIDRYIKYEKKKKKRKANKSIHFICLLFNLIAVSFTFKDHMGVLQYGDTSHPSTHPHTHTPPTLPSNPSIYMSFISTLFPPPKNKQKQQPHAHTIPLQRHLYFRTIYTFYRKQYYDKY